MRVFILLSGIGVLALLGTGCQSPMAAGRFPESRGARFAEVTTTMEQASHLAPGWTIRPVSDQP